MAVWSGDLGGNAPGRPLARLAGALDRFFGLDHSG
jgi:hypothetical protein